MFIPLINKHVTLNVYCFFDQVRNSLKKRITQKIDSLVNCYYAINDKEEIVADALN